MVEDSPARFAFDVVWGSKIPSAPDDYADAEAADGSHFVRALDFQAFGVVTSDSQFGPATFSIVFDGLATREFASVQLEWFSGSQVLALAGEAYGGRFVYGHPFSDPAPGAPVPALSVPEGGHAGWMLTAGLAVVGGVRWRTGSRSRRVVAVP